VPPGDLRAGLSCCTPRSDRRSPEGFCPSQQVFGSANREARLNDGKIRRQSRLRNAEIDFVVVVTGTVHGKTPCAVLAGVFRLSGGGMPITRSTDVATLRLIAWGFDSKDSSADFDADGATQRIVERGWGDCDWNDESSAAMKRFLSEARSGFGNAPTAFGQLPPAISG
jgi:hypothetical protein